MASNDQPDVPIWAAAKARQQIDVLREVARALAETERERASRSIGEMTESDLEIEQLRLEDALRVGTITVDDFRRLREIDFYLEGMRQRRQYDSSQEEWSHESYSE